MGSEIAANLRFNNNQDRVNTAIILKDQWAKIGVNVDIQQVDAANDTSVPKATFPGC